MLREGNHCPVSVQRLHQPQAHFTGAYIYLWRERHYSVCLLVGFSQDLRDGRAEWSSRSFCILLFCCVVACHNRYWSRAGIDEQCKRENPFGGHPSHRFGHSFLCSIRHHPSALFHHPSSLIHHPSDIRPLLVPHVRHLRPRARCPGGPRQGRCRKFPPHAAYRHACR